MKPKIIKIQILFCDYCGYEIPFDGGYYNEICPKCNKGEKKEKKIK